MANPGEFRELVSGRRAGARAVLLRGMLRAAEVPYTLAVRWRNRRYDRNGRAAERVSVPVVSVGNLTLGGTGKSPMVKWIGRWFIERNVVPAIVSRGYGAAAGQQNDEARELAHALPHVPHVQDRDRVAAARQASDEHGCQLVLLDDGFQHRRLARDLDIVLLDALEPFGFEHVFPRGTLREPLSGLARADVVCLSRADAVSPEEREAIRRRVVQLAPHAGWCEVAHAPSGLVNTAGEICALEALAGRRVAAFCGIGNPAGFRHTLSAAACDIVAWREFADHHAYRGRDLADVGRMANASNAEAIVCTQKDLVKVERMQLGGLPLWAVAIELRFLAGQEEMESALHQAATAGRAR